MVSGEQTNDFELHDAENANLIIAWGMNWIATKMPDSHWLTEARLKGAHTVAVTVEYSATASKCDDVIVIRPGTDPAFALGLSQVMIAKAFTTRTSSRSSPTCPHSCAWTRCSRCAPPTSFEGHTQSTPANWTSGWCARASPRRSRRISPTCTSRAPARAASTTS
jgi:nitrate reductase / nitrite oxidoreductase, alpha subunit